MARKKLTAQQEKEVKLLQANYKMYEQTKEEAKLRGTKQSLHLIDVAQQDIKAQLEKIDPSALEDVTGESNNSLDSIENIIMENKKGDKKIQQNLYAEPVDNDDKTPFDILEDEEKKTTLESIPANKPDEVPIDESNTQETVSDGYVYNNVDSNASYDVIPLPSNGECYKSKISRLPVGYLTAADENLITSPNLYKDGLVIDFLLKNKIVNNTIDPNELVTGDADAIILFLRATSYGLDFPITVYDPQTGKRIETSIDLSTIKSKPFKLKGDENGWFDFTLPRTKKVIKFKYLTRKEEKQLEKLSEMEDTGIRAKNVIDSVSLIKNSIEDDESLTGNEKQAFVNSLKKINDWATNIKSNSSSTYSKAITNRMEFQIQSINGVTDRKKIHEEVLNMLAGDSLALRKYINENEPGMDFEITVQRPESLGGGSFKTFLEWDDSVFLNIA